LPHTHTSTLPAAPDRVFQALTERAALEAWFAERVEIEPKAGGVFSAWGRYTYGVPDREASTGRVVSIDAPTSLTLDWPFAGIPSRVSLTLAPEGDGKATRISVSHELSRPIDQPRPVALIDDFWRMSFGNLLVHLSGGEVLRVDFSDPVPEVRLTINIDAPPSAVFRALIEPEAISRWVGGGTPVVDPRVGGSYSFGWKYKVDGRDVAGGPTRILEMKQDERLVLDWPDWRGDPEVPMQRIIWELAPDNGGTRVTFTHTGFLRAMDVSDYVSGWQWFASQLAAEARR
jgi:uncharacterized protein YndB with AHSA1/START domain